MRFDEPLSDEELQAIQERCEGITPQSPIVFRDCQALLREVDRLRAEKGMLGHLFTDRHALAARYKKEAEQLRAELLALKTASQQEGGK